MEFDRIRNLLAPIATSEGALGLRDDVAMLEARPGAIVTTDALVEAVHFLPSDPVNLVARKLVRVNVSDILAKGAAPVEALLAIGWPQTRPEHEFSDFVDGLADELSFWSINLIGGDSVKSPGGLFLSMTLTGHPLRQAPVLRGGAGVADDIYVTGEIGWGRLGLQAALRGDAEPGAIDHYRVPQLAGLDAAKLVAAHASSAMDISDGLLADMEKLCDVSALGAEVCLDDVPMANPTGALLEIMEQVTGGDDYQILFTAPRKKRQSIRDMAWKTGIKLTCIGEMTEARRLSLSYNGNRVPLPDSLGFSHP